jgi:hypothetical protein
VVPNGKAARLIPVKSGATEVAATAEGIMASAKVVVLDTVFSVQIAAADTVVTLGRSLQFSATVAGPTGASQDVTWSVADTSVARVDSTPSPNRVLISSRNAGTTNVIATATIDRKKSATTRFRTAAPVSLFFEAQPGDATVPIRAQDVMIPGPIVKVRDALGNVFPGPATISVSLAPGTGSAGASLLGVPVITTANGDARFTSIAVDLPGVGYRLMATAAELLSTTSAPFTVGPECGGIAYTLGTLVNGELTSSSCQVGENQYYDRYSVTSAAQQLLILRVTAPLRNGAVFPNGIPVGAQTDTIPYLVPAGSYSIRVLSSAAGLTGPYQLQARTPTLGKVTIGQPGNICYRIQTTVGISYQEELRCSGTAALIQYPCGSGTTSQSPFRLHLKAGQGATINASSTTIDPCLEIGTEVGTVFTHVAVDDNSGGGTSARIVIPAAPENRNFIVNVTGRPPIPAFSLFSITIQP